jgi:aspartate aminotransferase-like enzyme
MKKTYLLTPGPTQIPEAILAGFARPVLHHRTPAFKTLLEETRAGLRQLFGTGQDVLLLACSGTGTMDSAVSNLFCRGDAVITVNGGKFGERWTRIARAYGLAPIELELEPGEAVEPARLEELIRKTPGARAVLFQASETSTGVRMPTREICQIARAAGLLSVCDGITACGVFDLPMDDWEIDVLMTASQKALMLPPGLGIIALSERAWEASRGSDLPKFYFDLSRERESQRENQTAWTPAISLIQGLRESLRLLQEEGLPEVYRRHERLAEATRAGVRALGLELLARHSPSPAVTAVRTPPGIRDGKQIPRLLRDKHGVVIAGGQEELEGKIFRLSHFGYCGPFDITTALAALELTLAELGHPLELGTGVGAALRVFKESGL